MRKRFDDYKQELNTLIEAENGLSSEDELKERIIYNSKKILEDYYSFMDSEISSIIRGQDQDLLFSDYCQGYRAKMKAWMVNHPLSIEATYKVIRPNYIRILIVFVVGAVICGLSLVHNDDHPMLPFLGCIIGLLCVCFAVSDYRRSINKNKVAQREFIHAVLIQVNTWMDDANHYSESLLNQFKIEL